MLLILFVFEQYFPIHAISSLPWVLGPSPSSSSGDEDANRRHLGDATTSSRDMLSRNIARAANAAAVVAALGSRSQQGHQQHRQLRVLQEEEEEEVGDDPDDEVQRVRIDYVGTVTVTNCIFQVSYNETAVFIMLEAFSLTQFTRYLYVSAIKLEWHCNTKSNE